MARDVRLEKWRRLRFDLFHWLYHLMAAGVIGLSLFPAVSLVYFSWKGMSAWPPAAKVFVFSLILAPAYFVFGMALMAVSVALKRVFRLGIRPGLYRLYSDWEVVRWMGTNTFILIVNACFLDGFRVSPLQHLFYNAMGAKVGKDAQINTAGLADLPLVEIGENCILGGGTTLICHVADRGVLKLAPVKLGNGVSVGIDTIIMPGTTIGDGAVIAPRSFVAAGTTIPPRARYGGNPARDLREEKKAQKEETTS